MKLNLFVWGVKIVLDYLEFFCPIEDFSLYEITMKLVMLIALVTAQRAQTLSLLKVTNMFRSESNVIFCLDEHVKQSRVSNSGPLVVLRPFTENKNLCVVHTLDIYLWKIELLRGPDP